MGWHDRGRATRGARRISDPGGRGRGGSGGGIRGGGRTVSANADTLLTGLTAEVALYQSILAVSTEELALVKKAELEQATQVLARKQRLLEDVAAIENEIKPLKNEWPQIRTTLTPEEKPKFGAALKQLSDLLERLIALERETEDVLSGQIAQVRKSPVT